MQAAWLQTQRVLPEVGFKVYDSRSALAPANQNGPALGRRSRTDSRSAVTGWEVRPRVEPLKYLTPMWLHWAQ